MRFDAKVIDQLAEELYGEAQVLEVLYTVVGALIGAGMGSPLIAVLDGFWPIVLIAAALGGVTGYFMGQRAGLSLRAFAQLMLAQVRIEENTRPVTEARGIAGPSHATRESHRVGHRIADALNR